MNYYNEDSFDDDNDGYGFLDDLDEEDEDDFDCNAVDILGSNKQLEYEVYLIGSSCEILVNSFPTQYAAEDFIDELVDETDLSDIREKYDIPDDVDELSVECISTADIDSFQRDDEGPIYSRRLDISYI